MRTVWGIGRLEGSQLPDDNQFHTRLGMTYIAPKPKFRLTVARRCCVQYWCCMGLDDAILLQTRSRAEPPHVLCHAWNVSPCLGIVLHVLILRPDPMGRGPRHEGLNRPIEKSTCDGVLNDTPRRLRNTWGWITKLVQPFKSATTKTIDNIRQIVAYTTFAP